MLAPRTTHPRPSRLLSGAVPQRPGRRHDDLLEGQAGATHQQRRHISEHERHVADQRAAEDTGQRMPGGTVERREAGRAGAMDVIIAATAIAHDLTTWTQDSAFTVLQELQPALQIEVG